MTSLIGPLQNKGLLHSVVFVIMLGLVSCRGDGVQELELARDAMDKIKTVRMTSNVPNGTREFICPDKMHFSGTREGEKVEEILIGHELFSREDNGPWTRQTAEMNSGLGCDVWLSPLRGRQLEMRRNFDVDYLGHNTVDGAACDAWRARDRQYNRANGYPLDVDMIVCIDPASHRVREMKRDEVIWRFYDFDENIVISAPPATSLDQPGVPKSTAEPQESR